MRNGLFILLMLFSQYVSAYYYIAVAGSEVRAYDEPNGELLGVLPSGFHVATEFANNWTRVSLEQNIYTTGGYWVQTNELDGVYFSPLGDVCEQAYGDEDYNNPVCLSVVDQYINCKEENGRFTKCDVTLEYQLEAGELKGRSYVEFDFECEAYISLKNSGEKRSLIISFEESGQVDTESAIRVESTKTHTFTSVYEDNVHWVKVIDTECEIGSVSSY